VNFGTLVKYKQIFFRVGEVRNNDQKLMAEAPEYVTTIVAPEENNARYISRPHYRFMKDFLPVLRDYPRMHGEGTVILTHTVNEDEGGG
jgi:hypothetical protein